MRWVIYFVTKRAHKTTHLGPWVRRQEGEEQDEIEANNNKEDNEEEDNKKDNNEEDTGDDNNEEDTKEENNEEEEQDEIEKQTAMRSGILLLQQKLGWPYCD